MNSKHTEAISAVDRAWLEMDDRHNPMVVSAVLELRGVADLEALVRHVVSRLVVHRRFCQRIDDRHSPPVWRDDDALLLESHVRIFHLAEDAPEHDVAHAVARELAQPLDRVLPLWRITLFVRAGGGVTLLFRAHHALADGMALVGVLMGCTDGAAAQPPARRAAASAPWTRATAVLARLGVAARRARDARWRRAYVGVQSRAMGEAMLAIARVLALPDDNPACLRRPLSGRRAVAWTEGMAFEPIRAAARRLDVKINDLFLTAVAGAFGRSLRAQEGALDPQQNLRISLPVNLRAPGDGELGNRFGLVLVDLPVGIADPQQRLAEVARRMRALKRSPEARVVLAGLAAAGHLPVTWEKSLVRVLAGKAAAVVSNLPGPREPLRVAGARLENLVFWPPQAGGIGLGLSLFSYAGQVSVGVCADTAQLHDPARLIRDFETEIAALLTRPQPRLVRAAAPRQAPAAPPARRAGARAPSGASLH